MKRTLIALSFISTICAGSASAKLYIQEPDPACRAALGSPFGQTGEIADEINARTLSQEILLELNRMRCDHGLAPLGALADLREVSTSHAKWMSRAEKLSYETDIEGREKLLDRLNSVDAPILRGRQSILRLPGLQVEPKKSYKVKGGRCLMEDSDGTALEKHTYRSLAKRAVASLIKTGQHRRSILSKDMTHAAAGAALSFEKSACGTVYISIHYVGMREQRGKVPFQSRY